MDLIAVFKVCIRIVQEECGGVQDKDSIDLTANAFIRLNKTGLGNTICENIEKGKKLKIYI